MYADKLSDNHVKLQLSDAATGQDTAKPRNPDHRYLLIPVYGAGTLGMNSFLIRAYHLR